MRQANPKVFSYSQRIDKKTNPILTLVEMDRFKDKIKELLGQSQQFASIGQHEGARKAWDLAKVLSKKYLDHFPYSYAWGLARGLYQDAKGNIRESTVQVNPQLDEKKKIIGKWQGKNIDISPEDSKLLVENGIKSTERLSRVSEEAKGMSPPLTYSEFMGALKANEAEVLKFITYVTQKAKKATVASTSSAAPRGPLGADSRGGNNWGSTSPTIFIAPVPPKKATVAPHSLEQKLLGISPKKATVAPNWGSTSPTITSLTPISFTQVFKDGTLVDLQDHEFFQKCEFFMAQEHIFPWESSGFPVGVWKKKYMEKVAGATQAEVEDLKRLFTQISPTFSTLEGKIKDLLVNKSIKQLSILDKDFLNTHVKLVNKIKKELMTGNMTLK